MKLDPIDELIALAHGQKRTLDCIVAFKLESFIEEADLRNRAHLAQVTFPKTAKHPVLITYPQSMNEFVNSPLPSCFHLELGLYKEDSDHFLALKMSHLLGDAVSMIIWIKALLSKSQESHPLTLLKFPSKKDSRFRKLMPCHVWPMTKKKQTVNRRVLTRRFEHKSGKDQREVNNLLSLSLLDSLPNTRKGLWIPVNVRQNFWQGFGNGLSRMRLYPPEGISLKDKLTHLKLQKKEARTSGEISLPKSDVSLHTLAERLLLKAWIKRPWADWGTISFSHLSERDGMLLEVKPIWGVSNIMPSHYAAIFAITYADETLITCTYDSGALNEKSVIKLLDQFELSFKAVYYDFNS